MSMSLKAHRANRNLTQCEAAKQLGVSDNTLRSWEKGLSFPDVSQIKKIEELYETNYNDINFLPDSSVLSDIPVQQIW